MKRAILLIDHGSRRLAANELILEVADLLRREAPEEHVEVAHLELAQPTIEQGFDACVAAGARAVTVCPYMLAPGRHVGEDIPRLVEEAAARHPDVRFVVAEPLGVHRYLARIVLERAREAEVRTWR